MEKYSAYNDKASGLNPFVPTKLPKANIATQTLGMLLCVLRIPLLIILLLLIGISDFIDILVSPIPPLRSLLRMILRAPLARLLLLVFGYWWIKARVADTRRLRLGRPEKLPQFSFGSAVKRGDIVVCNHSSFIDVLYVAYALSADTCVLGASAGDVTFKAATQSTLLGALWRAMCIPADTLAAAPTSAATTTTAAATATTATATAASPLPALSHAALVFFPENVPSNNTALLQFDNRCDEWFEDKRVHVLGLSYCRGRGPNTVASPMSDALSLLCWPVNHLEAVMVAHETIMAAQQAATAGGDTDVPPLRNLLALCVGERGVKTVELGATDYVRFMGLWKENATGAGLTYRKNR